MRLVEVRLLDGPNIYRLEPTVKIEVTVGRRRTWYGQRLPARHAIVRLGQAVPRGRAPRSVGDLVDWVRRLHRRALGRTVPVTIHRTSEPGHWIVAFPWRERQRAETLANAALRLVEERTDRREARALRLIGEAGTDAPEWIRDEQRRVPIVSISGTNGKSTTTRMISHILAAAGRTVGNTTTDGVVVGGEIVEEGDYTGPLGAWAVLSRPEVDVAVLETARGGILLRGLGYQSNDASVLTNISADHLDLQGVHTLPELAEVKSVIARVTRPDGTVVLNADDRLVAGIARRVRGRVCLFSLRARSARVRRHLAAGGQAMVVDDGWIVALDGDRRTRVVRLSEVPTTIGGLARHNVANALAAAAAAHALGIPWPDVAAGLQSFRSTSDHMPGRLNLYRKECQIALVDYAHNEAGLEVVLDVADALLGRRGRRRGTVTAVVGTAGDRPEDSLRELGRLAASRADEVAIKETLRYLRGRSRQAVIGEIREGMRAGGAKASEIPVYEDEVSAMRGELTTEGRAGALVDGAPRLVLIMAHADRPGVQRLLEEDLGFVAVENPAELAQEFARGASEKRAASGRAAGASPRSTRMR